MTLYRAFPGNVSQNTGNSRGGEDFFSQMFAGLDEPTLPLGLQTSDAFSLTRSEINLDTGLVGRLRYQAQSLDVSVESLCHLAWALVLARISGCDDVAYGVELAAFKKILPIRIKLRDASLGGLTYTTHELLAELHNYAQAPLAPLFETISLIPPTSVMSYRNASDRTVLSIRADGDSSETKRPENYPLSVIVQDLGEGLQLTVLVQMVIDPRRICDFMHTAVEQLVGALETAADTVVQSIDVMPKAERHKVLAEWNRTDTEYPKDKCVHELFEDQVTRTPKVIAVVHEDREFTYTELNARANRLAHYLRELGVKPDDRVAICVERSLEMVAGLLAILKAGGAYVPFDPAYPAERLAFMLKDSAPVAVLTQSKFKSLLANYAKAIPVIDLEADAPSWASRSDADPDRSTIGLRPDHLAYVIYTSGSTGMPKGVLIEHQGLCNYLAWAVKTYSPKYGSVVSSSLSFDATVTSLYTPLLCGTEVRLLPQGKEIDALNEEVLAKATCGLVKITPAHLDVLGQRVLQEGARTAVELFVVGGEALPASTVRLWRRIQPDVRIVNEYGPTETVVGCTIFDVPEDVVQGHSTPIGHPIANTRIYILDGNLQPSPIGVAGEIYIGGAGVARGYLNRPELTAERFLLDPFWNEPNARMYKTGDLGRWRADGAIEYLGRNDFQVKIRGFRIELGEIEARLAEYPGVREAIALAREDTPGDKRLVAYYVGEEGLDAKALRTHLAAALPDYMVPAAYVKLDALPLNANGKLDRQTLPAPDSEAYGAGDYEAPGATKEHVLATNMERMLAEIWADVLKVERVGRHDDFFDLGGHSLLAIQLISRVQQVLGLKVQLIDLFDRSSLADFAALLDEATGAALVPIPTVDRAKPIPLSFGQQRLWFLAQFEGASEAYHIPYNLKLTGELDREALGRALDHIVSRHEALRTIFEVVGGEPFQRIAPASTRFALAYHDLRGRTDREAECERLAEKEASAPFDLARGPLIRGRLVRKADEEYALLITMHHIVSDGWSMAQFAEELKALYSAFLKGEPDPLPALPVQYAEFSAWEKATLAGTELAQEQIVYWKKALAGAPALLELPADHPRPAQQNYAGAAVEIELDAELTQRLRDLSGRHGVTLYVTFLAAWAALLARLSGQDDVVIGSPAAKRSRSEFEPMIGFFVNTLPIRIYLSGSLTVSELLAQVKKQTLAAQQHQDLPFEQVVEAAQPERSPAYSPLFQVMFAWQNMLSTSFELPRLRVASITAPHTTAQFDLALYLNDADEVISGRLEYATSLFEHDTIERYLGYWKSMLEAFADDDGEDM